MPLQTPIVFLVFNRPDLTERVFETIRQARPIRLHVVADGPRADRPAESERCATTRSITERIDWPCEVTRDYSSINLGCGRRVSSGISLAFKQLEEAIILEDDCLPDPTFFTFAEELLIRYRHDQRVMAIIGDNLQGGKQWGPHSYFFSKYFHAWGWATWRRAWEHYDFEMTGWAAFSNSLRYESICPDPLERNHWHRICADTVSGRLDTWDYQWMFSCWLRNGLTACPQVNLVSNIGFGPDATHCTDPTMPDSNVPSHSLGALSHPLSIEHMIEADRFYFDHVLGGRWLREEARRRPLGARLLNLPRRLGSSLARLLGVR
jgi:hypothetical protein